MRVLAISHSCVTDVNQQLYVALDCLPGAQVSLIVPSNWKSEYTDKTLAPSRLSGVDFPVHALPVAVPGHNSLHFYRLGLNKVLRDFNPDVVFLDEEPWSLAALQVAVLCRRCRIPLVCYTKQNISKRYPLPFRRIEQRIYRQASAIAALSEEVRGVLRRKGFRGKCALLAHACDLDLFYTGDGGSLRETLDLSGLVIGVMGRFVPEKGFDSLVAALSLLAKRELGMSVTGLFVGSGPEEARLRQAAAAFQDRISVVFTGSVPHRNAPNFLRCMDIFVIPSRTTPAWKEQFGRVIIEALACGIPVIGSSSGQIPVLIQETGGGLVFQEGNAEDLAQKLFCLLSHPEKREHLGRTGQTVIRSSFTYDAVAQQLYGILEDAAREKAP